MFDTISGNYDGLNKIISLGTDATWKKKILQMVQLQQPTSILDIATGTGDLAILLSKTNAEKIKDALKQLDEKGPIIIDGDGNEVSNDTIPFSNKSIFKQGLHTFENHLTISKDLLYFWDGKKYYDIALSNSMWDRKAFTLCEKKILTRYNKLKYKDNPLDVDKSYIIV
jgi:hypothetical protein